MNKIGEIVAHYSKNNNIINFGVITGHETRDKEEWIKIKWTNREFQTDDELVSEELWMSNNEVEVVEPFGLLSDLHLAMIEQAKVHFVKDDK
tara:strand:+ start:480 stop:755 length:276 start_codon:yes stop_codon:yes gene_type:complete